MEKKLTYKDYVENRITRDDARRYFWEHGLTYEKAISFDNILKLGEFININIHKYNTGNEHPYFVRVIRSSLRVFNYHGYGDRAFIRGRGSYFADREVISFNSEKDTNTNNEHWIGFCGDADDKNCQPILQAFIEWCDWLLEGGEQ